MNYLLRWKIKLGAESWLDRPNWITKLSSVSRFWRRINSLTGKYSRQQGYLSLFGLIPYHAENCFDLTIISGLLPFFRIWGSENPENMGLPFFQIQFLLELQLFRQKIITSAHHIRLKVGQFWECCSYSRLMGLLQSVRHRGSHNFVNI